VPLAGASSPRKTRNGAVAAPAGTQPVPTGEAPSVSAPGDEAAQEGNGKAPAPNGKYSSATARRIAVGGDGSSAHAYLGKSPAKPARDDELPLLGVAGLAANPATPTTGEYVAMARSRRRALIRLGIFVLLVALVAEVLYLGPLTDPATGMTSRVPSPIPLAEVQPYGVNTFLQKEVESWKKDQTLSMARDLGVGWIKQQFPWADIEYRADPNNPFWDVKNNQNAWTKYDDIVSLAQKYSVRIIARIDSAPPWSHPGDDDAKAPPDAAHLADFDSFIRTFVTRYRGTVAAIQVWNEPNLTAEWATGNPVNAAEYTALLKTAYQAAKQADPDMIVLPAPLATNNEQLGYAGNLNELDYLQQMYDAGAKPYFDAMSANAYGTQYPPEDPPTTGKLNFRRVELLHDVMVKNGDNNKSVWFNEYGWNASPASVQPQPWGSVTPDQQADYTVRGIEYARANWPWAGAFTIWYLRQVGDIPSTQSEYWFQMVTPDFLTKPVYRSVQKVATTDEQVATPGDWGPLSPPVQAPPDWRIGLNPSVPGRMYVSPMSIGSKLDVPFLGSDLSVMLVPEAAATNTQLVAARYYVTIDGTSGKVAHELPRDANGQAYIDVPVGGNPVQVVVARDIGTQTPTAQHLLEITVAANPSGAEPQVGGQIYSPVVQAPDLPGIGIISVQAHRSYGLFAVLALLIVIALVFAVLALRRSRPSVEASATGR
jgi:hypothetical protein